MRSATGASLTPVPSLLLLIVLKLLSLTATAWVVQHPHLPVLLGLKSSWMERRRDGIFTSGSLLLAVQENHDRQSNGTSESLLPDDDAGLLITTGLLKISYDGSAFSGWTVGDDNDDDDDNNNNNNNNQNSNGIRSVRGVLRATLAKLYGNVDPSRIIVEGCSRTDKGVHAIGMVAQFYCLVEKDKTTTETAAAAQLSWLYPHGQPSIPGKLTPHPRNATDTSCFVPLSRRRRHQQDALSQWAYALNRMCPEDVQVMACAPVPSTSDKEKIPFHPTLSAHRKTYRYHFSVGALHDPTQIHTVWHIGNSDDGMLECRLMQQACAILQGRHDFTAFRGAPRGPDDKRKFLHQDPFCMLEHVSLDRRHTDSWFTGSLAQQGSSDPGTTTTTYTLEITGDRFLYKMVRFLVGAIVAVGRQRMSLTELERLVTMGDRTGLSWECAPAHGLQLYDVCYHDPPIEWQTASR